jgi:hypothetical protein
MGMRFINWMGFLMLVLALLFKGLRGFEWVILWSDPA